MIKSVVRSTGIVAIAFVAIAGLVACSTTEVREAAPATSGVTEPAQSAAVVCPELDKSQSETNRRKVTLINETSFDVKLKVDNDSWSCSDYSGKDNPSQFNNLVVSPNFGSTPVQFVVTVKLSAPDFTMGVQGKIGSPDLPWISLASTAFTCGGYWGCTPVKGTTLAKVPLTTKTGDRFGWFLLSSSDHTGETDDKYFNSLRFFSMDSWVTG